MQATQPQSSKPVSAAQLRREGFSARQVRELKALRDAYPVREHITSSHDMRRLELLRWMHRNGRLDA